ncbi:hypothetical protein FRC02_003072 [Tulasnella sp. 418]|nr:hypothetical protein FRC02_003072 [Tulasnella sp. 418]
MDTSSDKDFDVTLPSTSGRHSPSPNPNVSMTHDQNKTELQNPDVWMEDNNPYNDIDAPGEDNIPEPVLDSTRNQAEAMMQHAEENLDDDDPNLEEDSEGSDNTSEHSYSQGSNSKTEYLDSEDESDIEEEVSRNEVANFFCEYAGDDWEAELAEFHT